MSKPVFIPLYNLPENIIPKKYYVTKSGRSCGKEEKRRQLLEYIEKKRRERQNDV